MVDLPVTCFLGTQIPVDLSFFFFAGRFGLRFTVQLPCVDGAMNEYPTLDLSSSDRLSQCRLLLQYQGKILEPEIVMLFQISMKNAFKFVAEA